jgi:Ca-activated chloride channel family protein
VIELRYPFLLLLLIPALWAALRAPYRWGIPHERPTSALEHHTARVIPAFLAILLVAAASGPEWRIPVRGRAPVVDFAVVLDGSSSMKALDDEKESRWNAARRLLKTFIAGRPDDRFSVVLFSAHPVTLSPLTADHLRLWTMLERLELDSRDDGTAIGSALMTAVRRLSDSPARSRVILLLTDGAQNRGRVSGQEAAIEAKNQGIRVHTMLIGRPGAESLYPIDGGGFAKLKVDTDPDTLRQIALLTGGEFLSADDPSGLERSLAAVDKLEKTALPVDAPSEGRPLAKWILAAAAILALPLAIDLARKRGRKRPAWVRI